MYPATSLLLTSPSILGFENEEDFGLTSGSEGDRGIILPEEVTIQYPDTLTIMKSPKEDFSELVPHNSAGAGGKRVAMQGAALEKIFFRKRFVL